MLFKTFDLDKNILETIDLLGYKNATPVQAQTIPKILDQKDLIVKSQTGSGKTASFAIPICNFLNWEENKPQALVLTPTRELAMQVKEDFFNIGRFKRIKAVGLYGKAPFHIQAKELKQKTHVAVGTPGRILDHLEKNTLNTSEIKFLVIDEADEMLRMGFIEQVEEIISYIPENRITLLFSATMSADIQRICSMYLKDPEYIEIESTESSKPNISQFVIPVKESNKLDVLQKLTVSENPDSCIIFCNQKQSVDSVFSELKHRGYSVEKIHGDIEQRDRFKVMSDFKKGYFRYLVATDVAARGIDIDHITHVINFDVPQKPQTYVHRIGRTGRAGKIGKAFTLLTKYEDNYMADIKEYTENEINTLNIDSLDINNLENDLTSKEAFTSKMNEKIEIKAEKGEVLSQNIIKIHINAGKKTKMRPVDIVGTLCNLPNMSAEDIGIINIQDISTYVEILNGKGDMVFDALQTKPIKGRLRRVSKA